MYYGDMSDLQPFSWMILVFVGIFLIALVYGLFNASSKKPGMRKIHETGEKGAPGVCPVCGSVLKKGESIKSAVYPGKEDKLCYIYGCPHCYPACIDKVQRACPVCKNKIGQEAHLIARYFNRKKGTDRVHILGCSNCRFRS
jgi:hypothetical protein